ncbi:Y_Y_Y domain protein [Sporotomaculum syntrophicum]|uniref:Y_Y_Y domain protein n=1 Tax=Sporotomaculum syntrophicum TaxID=182264 RepID=A0A9D2WS79_9FIRM|nr:Ig-like domain-containing protein [Sporotomaculum syntrophicum]KAF1085956.1 Y_Y_Y domain protein [Sporotomaculum syntrophicum]
MKQKNFFYIFLTLIFLFSMSFVQLAQAATIDAKSLQNLFNRLDNTNKWDWYKTRVDDSLIAWDESHIMRSYLLMYEATKDKQYLNKFIEHADSVLARRDSVRGVTDYRGLSLPAWRSGYYTDYKTYYIYAVQTGLTAAPLAQFATIVKKDQSLSTYSAKANKYLQAAKDAIDAHDMSAKPQYLEVNSRWIVEGNTIHLARPINMNLAQGSAMLSIYEASGDKAYLNKATKIANYFKKYLRVNTSSNAYVWNYFPDDSRFSSIIEDLNHSVLDNEFIYLAYRNGIFNNADMQKFANTASKVLIKKDGSIANYLDGTGTASMPGAISHWLWFEPWAPSLLDVSYKLLAAKSSVHPVELQGVALLNYAFARNNTSNPEPDPSDPTPEPVPVPGNLITNGDFNAGMTGWVNNRSSAVINSEANGNKYLTNTYNFDFFQVLNLKPGTYTLNAKAKKGTAAQSARIVIQFFHSNGSNTVPYAFTYSNKGSGWEAMPEMTVKVPDTAITTRVYLSVNGGSGNCHFDDISLVAENNTTPVPDKQGPDVVISAPVEGSELKDTATINIATSDESGVSRVVIAYATGVQDTWTTIGEATLSEGTKTNGTWKLTWDVANIKNGTYYIHATAEDSMGNTSTSKPVTCLINNPVTNTGDNLITNGDFNAGMTGWVNNRSSAVINSEANGNKYLTNTYNFDFFQVLNLKPGTYTLNAKAKKGTAAQSARIVIQFFHSNGSNTVPYAFTYSNKGSGWEAMPEMTVKVPDTAITTRVYLSVNGGSGNCHFDDISLVAKG